MVWDWKCCGIVMLNELDETDPVSTHLKMHMQTLSHLLTNHNSALGPIGKSRSM